MTPHPYGWLSLLPPIVAIVLAIATRRIVLSLVMGIFAGALLMAGGNPLEAIYHTWETHLWRTLIDPGKLRVFSFTLLMGAMIGIITRSGGMRGLIQLVSPYASNRRRGQLSTWLMGMLIFFDDYANTILLGSTLRPICDRIKISREKLAYLVDSTAAPVAGLVPLSTWVAVEIDYIGNGLESVTGGGLTAFGLFLSSIPYRFYMWSALLLIPITAWLGRDIGPMAKAEQRAATGYVPDDGLEVDSENQQATSSWINAVLPIAFTLTLVVYFIFDSGRTGACSAAAESAIETVTSLGLEEDAISSRISEVQDAVSEGVHSTRAAIGALADAVKPELTADDETRDLSGLFEPRLAASDVLGAADSSMALQYGALGGLLLACLLPICTRLLTLDELVGGATAGARVVLPAVAILWTASAMSKMTTDQSVDGVESQTAYEFKDHRLYTADYLTTQLSANQDGVGDDGVGEASVAVPYLPTVVFVLAAVVAFCTGTSWGTMGILVPMVVQTAFVLLSRDGVGVSPDDPILLGCIGGVLAGAVFGDHCSPISDTTVLSSQSSGCDHLAHVWTQIPYALLAGAVSILLGTLPLGFGVSIWLLFPLQLAALVIFMRVMGRPCH